MHLLLVAGPHAALELARGAEEAIDAFVDKDGFECCVAEDYAGGEEAV